MTSTPTTNMMAHGLTLSFTCKRGWRGPCFARDVTAGPVSCMLLLGLPDLKPDPPPWLDRLGTHQAADGFHQRHDLPIMRAQTTL